MYGQETSSKQRRSFDDIAAEVDAEFNAPKTASRTRPSFDDIAREVDGFSTDGVLEKPANQTVKPKSLTTSERRFADAGRAIRDIEAKKQRAVSLFQEADKTPEHFTAMVSETPTRGAYSMRDSSGKVISAREELRARAEGELETANRLGAEAKKKYGDLIEVGYGDDADKMSNRKWVYAKPRNEAVEYYRRPGVVERAGQSTREEIDRDVRQQERLKSYRKDYDDAGMVGRTAQRLATGYLSNRPDLTPDERDELAIRRQAQGVPSAEEITPGASEDFTDRILRGTLDVIPSGVAGLANLADTAYRGAQRLTGNRLPVAAEWGPTAETWARDVSNTIAPFLPVDPKRNKDFSSKLASGIGSAAGFGAASKLAGAARISTPVAVGTVGAGVGADEIVREAREAGFDPTADPARWDRMVALGGASGMTEIFGFGKMLDRWGLKRPFTKRALETLEEGGQEALQQFLGNVNAAYVGQYDPNRPLTKDVLENAIIGSIIGGGTQAADVAAERMSRQSQQHGDPAQQRPPEAQVAPVVQAANPRDGKFDVNLDPNGPIRMTAVGDGSKRGQTQKNLTLTYQNGQFDLQEHVPLEQADPQNQVALIDFLERLPQQPGTPPEMAAAAKSLLPQIRARLAGTAALPTNQAAPAAAQSSTPATLFPNAQQPQQAAQQNLAALDPQQRVAAMLDRLRQQQEGRKAASLEQQLNTEFAEAGALVDGAARDWDANRPTAEQMASAGAGRLKTALQNLQKSEAYAAEIGAVASGTARPGPYIAAAQALQAKLDQAQGLFGLDAERQKAAEKAQREAEIAAEKAAREQQRVEEQAAIEAEKLQRQAAIQQQREAATATRLQKAQTAKEARRAQLEQQQQQARDEKARRRANDELQRLAIHDAALQAADDAGARHQEYLNNGQIAEAVNELLVQQRQIQDAIKTLPRTPEAQKTKADLNRYAGQIGNRIGDLRAQMRGRTVPVTSAIPPLLQSDAAVNPEGGVPELPSFYEPGAQFERLAANQSEASDTEATPLLTAIRRLGGIKDDGQFSGELRQFTARESGTTGVVNNRTGLKPDRMREALVEEGLLPDNATIDDMFRAMGQSASPRNQETISDFYERWAGEDGETGGQGDGETAAAGSSENIPDGIEPDEWDAYQRTLSRYDQENLRPDNVRTRPAKPGAGGVSYSPYNILTANNKAAVDRLYELDLNSPEAQRIIAELRDYSERSNIAPRHLGNLLNYVRNYQMDQAFWADQGLSLETVQRGIEDIAQATDAMRRRVNERTPLEREVAAIDSVFDDLDMRDLLDRAITGDNTAARDFTELGVNHYGLEPETAAELIRTRQEDRASSLRDDRRGIAGTAQADAEGEGIQNPSRPTQSQKRGLQPLYDLLRQNPANVPDAEFDDYLRSLESWRNENIHGEQFGGVDLPDGLERDLRRKISFTNEERRERVKQKRLSTKHEPLPILTPEQRAERAQLAKETRDLPPEERQARFAELRRKQRESGETGQRLNKDQLGEKMRGQMSYPGKLQIKKQPGLTETQRSIEAKLAADVEVSLDDYLARYTERFGGQVINADNVKLLFDAFNADPAQNSAAVQTASSAIAGELFRRRLAAMPEGGNVAFLAGGPAAGKSVFLQNAGGADVILDTTMANAGNNARLIDGALAAGQNVAVVYVHRPAADAARGMIRRAVTEGRAVPEDYMARTHFNAQAALFETAERYQDNPRVQFVVVDNSGGIGEQKSISLAELKKLRYNRLEDVRRQIQTAVDEEYEKRHFADSLYRAITGADWSGRRLGGSVRDARDRSLARSEGASGRQAQGAGALQEQAARPAGDRPAGGSGTAGRVDDSTSRPSKTVSHTNPAIDGREVIRETEDGRVIVANPDNKTGISVVKPSTRESEPMATRPVSRVDSYWKTPRVERDKAGAIRNPQSVIPDSRAEFRQSTEGAGTLWLNEQGAIVIAAAAAEGGVTLGAADREFLGVSMSLPSVRKTLVALRNRAEQYGAPVEALTGALEEAMQDAIANGQRAVVISDTATSRTLTHRKQTIREERYHQWQQTHGLMTIDVADMLYDKLQSDPVFQQIQSVLLDPAAEGGGYINDPALLITEAAAKMASGQWQQYDVDSEAEGLNFLHRYMRAAVEMAGPQILQARIVGTPQAQGVFEDVREIKGIAGPARRTGLERGRSALASREERGGASKPVPSGGGIFRGVAVEGRGRSGNGQGIRADQREAGEVIPLEGEQRVSLPGSQADQRISVGLAEGGEIVPIGRQSRAPSSSFEGEERVAIESPETETVPLGQSAQAERSQPSAPPESPAGAMSYRQALRTFRQRQKVKEQQKAERAKQARLGRASLDPGNPLVVAMRGLTDADLDAELSAIGIDPVEHKNRDDKMRAALLAMQEYQPDVRGDAFDKTQREIARRAANALGVAEKAARDILRTADEAITAPKEDREAEYIEAWERLSALSARELDALKWLDSRGGEPLSTAQNPLAATMNRLRAQQVLRGATVKNLIALGVEQLRKLGRAMGINLPATGREFTERQEVEEWAHVLANVNSAMQKLGAPTVGQAKEIVINAFTVQNSRDFKRSMRTLRNLTTAEILTLRNIEADAGVSPSAARSVSLADDPQGEPQKLANAMDRMTAPKRAATKVGRLQAEEARRQEEAAAARRAEYGLRPAASETVQADTDRLARLRRTTGLIEPVTPGRGGGFSLEPKTTPLRSIVTEHQPLFVDPLKLQEAALDQILKAGASGTLPGARALHWASKLKLKRAADKLANRQANFIQNAIQKTDDILAASDAMQAATPGSDAYKKARAEFYARRRELHAQLQKTGEYAGPFEYLAKYGKAALLTAPHILTNNVLDHLASFPFHEAQKLMGFLLPVRALQRWGVDVERTHVDLRGLVPAMAREFKAILKGTKDAMPDFVNMLRYGTTDLLLDEEVARQQVGDLDEQGIPRTGGADRYEFGKAAKGVPGLDQAIRAIGRTHGAVDVVGRRWAFTTALVSQADAIAKRIGKENGFDADEIGQLREDLAAEPSAQMIVLAMDEANRFVLDYPTFLHEKMQTLRRVGAEKYPLANKAWNNALDFVVKFQKIPLAAQAQSLWHYTPMGLVGQATRVRRAAKQQAAGKPISKQESAEIVERLQQGALGSLMWAAAGLLGSLGYLQFTGGDDRERVRNAEEAQGYGYDPELMIGDTGVKLNRFGTVGRTASVAARLAKAAEQRKDVKTGETEEEGKRLKRVGKAFMKGVVLDNPVGRGVGEMFASDTGDPFENFARGQIRSLQPGILREAAKLMDSKKRIPDNNSFSGKVAADFKSGNPWMRESLQPRLDALGREIEEENPFAFTRSIRREPQLDEMMRLGTGPAKPQRQKNEKGDEYNERVRDRAAQSIRAMERIAGDPKQSTRSDEAKARIYSEGLSTDKRSPLNMERAEKVGAESAQTEREIEALRADAYEALRQLPAYQRLKDSDKERVRGLINGRLKSYRGRAASSRAREKTARLPEFSPAELARTAMQGTSSRE